MRKKKHLRKPLELGELKYDSFPKNPYFYLGIIFLIPIVIYLPIFRIYFSEFTAGWLIILGLVLPMAWFSSLGWTKTIHRFRIYSKGMNMMAVTYSGNPSKPEWGHITGNKKFKYSTIVAIYPYRLPRLNYEGLTIDLPSKKKQWTGLIFLKEEEANAVINILKEQMGDLWYEKYKGKNPERVT